MGFWSVTVWLVFEAFNLVLKNWGYAGVLANPWVRWPGYALAFATVLPGVLLGAEVLAALGAWRGLRGRPVKLPWAWEPAGPAAGHGLPGPAPGLAPLLLPPGLGGRLLSPGPLRQAPGRPLPHPGLARRASAGSISACWPPGCSAASGGRPGTIAPRPNGSTPCRC